MMTRKVQTPVMLLLLLFSSTPTLYGQTPEADGKRTFAGATVSLEKKLEDSINELNELRETITKEQIPLNRKLNEVEAELTRVRLKYQQTTRLLDSNTLDITNLRNEIRSRREEATYLSNLLSEYIRNFESRLHIVEMQRYKDEIEEAKLALENTSMAADDVYVEQSSLLATSLERLIDALSGTRFSGRAVNKDGLVKKGDFILVGPTAIFKSEDKGNVGMAEQRLGSLEPSVIEFLDPANAEAAVALFENEKGRIPFDPTLGNAHKIEATKETFLEHVQKGGPVMYPIFGMAAAALIVALLKWIYLSFQRMPSQRKIQAFLKTLQYEDKNVAMQAAVALGGPIGRMLSAGVEHLKEPKELIEEVMYEMILATRLKMQSFLPFIAICASSAPLLGLLGTVTGIINTFKLITVFGSGDVKTLSGGISEALITTKFGLIVAIPSLLLHAFLSRKAKGIVDRMEKASIAFMNQVGQNQLRKKIAEEQVPTTPVSSGLNDA